MIPLRNNHPKRRLNRNNNTWQDVMRCKKGTVPGTKRSKNKRKTDDNTNENFLTVHTETRKTLLVKRHIHTNPGLLDEKTGKFYILTNVVSSFNDKPPPSTTSTSNIPELQKNAHINTHDM